jgi:kynureninase
VYLDGNSLGALPLAAASRLHGVIGREWGRRAIRGWGEGWMDLPVRVGEAIAGLVGAAPGQVIVGDSTTVCFYKLAWAALGYGMASGRDEIVCDAGNFPTDRYVIEGLAASLGASVVWLASASLGAVERAVGPSTALVTLSHVSYGAGEVCDMAAVCSVARSAGALTLWDVSHSAGSLPVSLDDAGADLAVGCTYKYLNGGPGAPAFMYVRSGLQEVQQPIWGWLGHADPFAMGPVYEPAAGMRGFLSGTPPVLALSAVEEGVRVVGDAGLRRIRTKGVALTEYLIGLADARLGRFGMRVASPREAAVRGSHVVLGHSAAARLVSRLADVGVICDFREPDLVRIGCSPLTTRFVDVWDAVEALVAVLSAEG